MRNALTTSLGREMDELVAAFRNMLDHRMIDGQDGDAAKALNKARLQERLLSITPKIDQTQACQFLGLSLTNPSATLKRKEGKGEILRFDAGGRAAYPLFQFDIERQRIFPVIKKVLAVKPETWSNFRLLHWLTTPHLDFDRTPAESLESREGDVLAAFSRAIKVPDHG